MLIKRNELEAGPVVELTPVIDMVFLLLIFFLVATTFAQEEREMQIALPEAESGQPISLALRELIINVDDRGTAVVSGRSVSLEELREIVTRAVEANPEQKVSVRADRGAPYGTVARVLDVCKASGINQPFLDTEPLGGAGGGSG